MPGRKPSKSATVIGLVFLAAGVYLSVGLAGGGYTNLGVLLLFVGGVTLLVDRTGTVTRRKAKRRRKRSRSSGERSSKETWLAPVEVIDMRGPSDAAAPSTSTSIGCAAPRATGRPAGADPVRRSAARPLPPPSRRPGNACWACRERTATVAAHGRPRGPDRPTSGSGAPISTLDDAEAPGRRRCAIALLDSGARPASPSWRPTARWWCTQWLKQAILLYFR